jgi:hypothetical protein
MSKKPCLVCEKECDVFAIQLGDFATLTYLRVCGEGCLFMLAYEYLHEINENKVFRNSLSNKENEEDRKERRQLQDLQMKHFLEEQRRHFEENPALISTPAPKCLIEMFANSPSIPNNCGKTMRFVRATKEERIEWKKKYVEEQKKRLEEGEKELREILEETYWKQE